MKKSSKLPMIAAFFLLAAGNIGFWFYRERMLPAAHAAAQTSEVAPTVSLESVALDPFLVNLSGGEGYVKVAISLAVASAPTQAGSHGDGGSQADLARSAAVRDVILNTLMNEDVNALLGPDGKAKLKAKLKAELDAQIAGLRLVNIYFTDFLIER